MHALRQTFASQAIEYGADVVEIRDILGDASLAATSRYLDANAQRLRRAIAAQPRTARAGTSPLSLILKQAIRAVCGLLGCRGGSGGA